MSIKSVCEGGILPLLGQLTNHSRNREVNEHENALFCRGGDWSVQTNPKGNCKAQKGHIRKRYNNKIESLKAFVVDTQNVLEAQKRRVAKKAEQKRLAAEQERLAAQKAEALRPKLIEAGIKAAKNVANRMNRNHGGMDTWETLYISGRSPRNEVAYGHLVVTVKLQEISSSSESELLEAAVKEIVNRMNQEQLEAIMRKVCINAPWSGNPKYGYTLCEEFEDGL